MTHYLSFSLAKQLHEAGFEFPKAEQVYLFIEGLEGHPVTHAGRLASEIVGVQLGMPYILIPAPCFEELWATLPFSIGEPDQHLYKELIETKKGEQRVQYYSEKYNYVLHSQQDASPTEAAGKLVVVLKEKNLLLKG